MKQRRQQVEEKGYLGLSELPDLLCYRGIRRRVLSFIPHAAFVLDSIPGAPFPSLPLLSFSYCPLPFSSLSFSRNWCHPGVFSFHPHCFGPSFGCSTKGRLHKQTPHPSWLQEVGPITGFGIILSWWTKDAIKSLFFPTFCSVFPS